DRLQTAPAYVVEPPDELVVTVEEHPDLTSEMTVRPDGHISLPLLGDIHVWGKSVEEVRREIQEGYDRYLKNGSVSVRITGFKSKFVYVYGEVVRPGAYPYTGCDTVVDVLARAGTLNWRAAPNRIQITRGDPSNPTVLDVRLGDIVIDDEDVTNYHLHQNDIVWVPPTFLVQVGDVVRQITWPFTWLLSPLNGAYVDYLAVQEIRD
ncbi:MAG: polysaccharide biosynthesis/export family protein, partial [Planctomycetota bacterium]